MPDEEKSGGGLGDQTDLDVKQDANITSSPEDEKRDLHLIEETGLNNEKNSTEEVGVGSSSKESTPDISVESKNNKSEYKIGVENKSNTPTDSDGTDEDMDRGASGSQELAPSDPSGLFVNRVSQGLRDAIDNKVTKDKTHKKTSLLLKNETLNRLANYDKAMGGRIQGIFINDLLDNFFDELEQQDEKWKKILNKKSR
ncbi:hypothetical protein D3C72_1454770 [compost metagenome]